MLILYKSDDSKLLITSRSQKFEICLNNTWVIFHKKLGLKPHKFQSIQEFKPNGHFLGNNLTDHF